MALLIAIKLVAEILTSAGAPVKGATRNGTGASRDGAWRLSSDHRRLRGRL